MYSVACQYAERIQCLKKKDASIVIQVCYLELLFVHGAISLVSVLFICTTLAVELLIREAHNVCI